MKFWRSRARNENTTRQCWSFSSCVYPEGCSFQNSRQFLGHQGLLTAYLLQVQTVPSVRHCSPPYLLPIYSSGSSYSSSLPLHSWMSCSSWCFIHAQVEFTCLVHRNSGRRAGIPSPISSGIYPASSLD